MRFKASSGTPKSCACPLPEKHHFQDEIECSCCTHLSIHDPIRWSKAAYCGNGQACIIAKFPYRLQYQWEMMNRCATVVGMGALDISVEKFKFFISDILGIEKDKWLEIYDIFLQLMHSSQKHKPENSHISADDIALIKQLSSEWHHE